ncbi:MAG: hypothetical protein QNI84_08065 [Henriciella sp.]|nr:hypothetical protein [Henriciella sp.]
MTNATELCTLWPRYREFRSFVVRALSGADATGMDELVSQSGFAVLEEGPHPDSGRETVVFAFSGDTATYCATQFSSRYSRPLASYAHRRDLTVIVRVEADIATLNKRPQASRGPGCGPAPLNGTSLRGE